MARRAVNPGGGRPRGLTARRAIGILEPASRTCAPGARL